MMEPDFNWTDYYNATGTEPRPALLRALEYFESNPPSREYAIDLGSGNGRDTLHLLKNGWSVTAIDSESASGRFLSQKVPEQLKHNFDFVHAPFEDLQLKPSMLVNSSYSLPFCSKECFSSLLTEITESICAGGLFTGNLFGNNDEWQNLSLISKDELLNAFRGYEIIYFSEEEKEGSTALGPNKYWHLLEITARKM